MKKLLIFALTLVGCSFKSNTEKTVLVETTTDSTTAVKIDAPHYRDSSTYFYFRKDHQFVCVKRNGKHVDVYHIDPSDQQNPAGRFRGEMLGGDTVYVEWRDYNQFDNDKGLLFEPGMGVPPDALRPIAYKLKNKEFAVEAYPSFDALIHTFKNSYIEIDSTVFSQAKKSALRNHVFPLPKYLHLMDRYYFPPSFPFHQKVEIRAKDLDSRYYKYFLGASDQFLPTRVRAIVYEDGMIGLTEVFLHQVDEEEALQALGELLKNVKVKNYSILNSPIKTEIFLGIYPV